MTTRPRVYGPGSPPPQPPAPALPAVPAPAASFPAAPPAGPPPAPAPPPIPAPRPPSLPDGASPGEANGLPKRGRPLPVYSDLLVPASGPSAPEDARRPAFPPDPARPATTFNPAAGHPHPGGDPALRPPPGPDHGRPDGGVPSIPQPRGPEPTELRVEPIPAPGPSTGAEAAPEPGKGGPPVSVIVGAVILGASLLVLAALGMPYLLQQLRTPASPSYAVGDCVVQDAGQARVVTCTHPGAYEITSQVADRDECPDPTNPTVAAGGDVFCLEPASAGTGAGSDSGDDPDTADDPDAEE